MKRIAVVLALVFLAMRPGEAGACSICRCGDQNFFVNNARMLMPGQFIFSIEHFNTRKSSPLMIEMNESDGQGAAFGKVPSLATLQHEIEVEESQVQNQVQAIVHYGLTSRLILSASVPYTFNHLTSSESSEKADGFGDPEVFMLGHLATLSGGMVSLQFLAGGRLPLGNSDMVDESGRLLDHHAQTGSGAWAGIFGLQLSRFGTTLPLFLSASYQLNGASDHDFRYGNILRYNLATQRELWSFLDLIAEINGRTADFDEEGNERDNNSGGTVVYASPGVRFRIANQLSLRTQAQVPVIKNLNGTQDEEVNVRTGLIWEM